MFDIVGQEDSNHSNLFDRINYGRVRHKLVPGSLSLSTFMSANDIFRS
jgi:hypothetical protein